MPTPAARWDTLSIDFIVELPNSGGYDMIMVVVDSVGKRAHFIETNTTISAPGTAELFLKHVWKLHGLPRRVTFGSPPPCDRRLALPITAGFLLR